MLATYRIEWNRRIVAAVSAAPNADWQYIAALAHGAMSAMYGELGWDAGLVYAGGELLGVVVNR